MAFALTAFGLMAGILTTLAGQGGGLFLLLVCSLLVGPHAALAITAPALLLGNLHRALVFRRFIDRSIAGRVVATAVPAAFVGGLLAGVIPAWVLSLALVALTLLALARAAGWLVFDVPRWGFLPAGAAIGAMTGTAGGAGVLFAPLLLSSGLSGRVFVATSSTIAFATHAGRVVAYGMNGFFSRELVLPTVLVAVAIFAGNALGGRLAAALSARTTTRLEYAVLVICVAVSLAGLA